MTIDFQTSSPGAPPSSDERLFALLVHLVPAVLYASVVVPLLVPVVVIVTKGSESRWVRAQAFEALNFQLTYLVVSVLGYALSVIGIGFCLLGVAALFALIVGVIGGVKAYAGESWRYPLCIRFLTP
jgi:uncharacterized Tic20 family protein